MRKKGPIPEDEGGAYADAEVKFYPGEAHFVNLTLISRGRHVKLRVALPEGGGKGFKSQGNWA